MCGIFSIVSYNSAFTLYDAVANLGEKARVLSYRGTQSAGILLETKNESDTFYRRILQDKVVAKGQKITNPFMEYFEDFYKKDGVTKDKTPFMGTIHTRWATTGGEPTEITAQPMRSDESGEFSLVLNGNLINANVLREEIIKGSTSGLDFKTTTDTEVIVRLFYEIYHEIKEGNQVEENGESVIKFEELCKHVCSKCRGLFTVVVRSRHYPDEVVAFANRQPLYVGFGSSDSKEFIPVEGEKDLYFCPGGDYFEFSSDSWALNENIQYFYKLEEGDIVKLSRDGLLLDRNTNRKYTRGKKGVPFIKRYLFKTIDVGSTEGSMLREITEQGERLTGIINARVKGHDIEFSEISEEMINKIIEKEHFYFVGCGSSYNVGMSVKQGFNDLALAKSVEAIKAAILVDSQHRVNAENAVYIFITQSGTTSDTNAAMEYCLERGALCIGVTNVIPSTASEKSHATIEVMAGFEVAVASTKAYTCQYLQLILFAAMLGKRKAEARKALMEKANGLQNGIDSTDTQLNNLSKSMSGSDLDAITPDMLIKRIDCFISDLGEFAEKVNDVITADISILVEYMMKAKEANSGLFLISRGSEYPTIVEAVLKISEVTQIVSVHHYSSELAHGPVAMVNKNTLIILVEPPRKSMQKKFFLAFEKIGTTNALPLIIRTSENSACAYNPSSISGLLVLPSTNYLLQGIITAIGFQRASHDVCVKSGNSPDVPPNLAKSVTVPT